MIKNGDGQRLISTSRARRLAAEAEVDPRTLVKILEGKPVLGMAGDRARRVLIAAGYIKAEANAA